MLGAREAREFLTADVAFDRGVGNAQAVAVALRRAWRCRGQERPVFQRELCRTAQLQAPVLRSIEEEVGLLIGAAKGNAWAALARRDDLLGELRLLDAFRTRVYDCPRSDVFIWALARSLVCVLHAAGADTNATRQGDLLDELLALARDFPDDDSMREQLAEGIKSRVADAIRRHQHTKSFLALLLDEFRVLARDQPSDGAVRRLLGRYLVKGAQQGIDASLDELRALKREHPEDEVIRGQLASALASAGMAVLNDIQFSCAPPAHAALEARVVELRALAKESASDEAVREHLARALWVAAAHEPDPLLRDASLNELRALVQDFPLNQAIRARCAHSLIRDLDWANQASRSDAVIEELRALSHDHPDAPDVRGYLSRGLASKIRAVSGKNALPNAKTVLGEIRALVRSHPENRAVRESLAEGLLSTIYEACRAGEQKLAVALLGQVRVLAENHPDYEEGPGWLVEAVRAMCHWEIYPSTPVSKERIRDSLVNLLRRTAAGQVAGTRLLARCLVHEGHLGEVRALHREYPEDATIRRCLATLLGSVPVGADLEPAPIPDTEEIRESRLDELRALACEDTEDEQVLTHFAAALCESSRPSKPGPSDLPMFGLDWPHVDTALDELRSLAQDHPGNPSVRKFFAKALEAAAAEGADPSILAELRSLAEDHPYDQAVRHRLAASIARLLDWKSRPTRSDALLGELRALSRDFPDDSTIRDLCAGGLHRRFSYDKAMGNPSRQDDLLREIHALALSEDPDVNHQATFSADEFVGVHPSQTATALHLDMLVEMMFQDEADLNIERRDARLRHIHILSGDDFHHERYADHIWSKFAMERAGPGPFDEPRDYLLFLLRGSVSKSPDNAAARQQLASTVFWTLHDMREGILPRHEASLSACPRLNTESLLEELRALNNEYAGDTAIRRLFAAGLCRTIQLQPLECVVLDLEGWEVTSADLAAMRSPRLELLDELRALARAHPRDEAVREQLVEGITWTLFVRWREGDLPRRDVLLHELRILARDHPDEKAPRRALAIVVCRWRLESDEGCPSPRAAMRDELRALAQDHPEDEFIVGAVARMLGDEVALAPPTAGLLGALQQSAGPLHELITLVRHHQGMTDVQDALDDALRWWSRGGHRDWVSWADVEPLRSLARSNVNDTVVGRVLSAALLHIIRRDDVRCSSGRKELAEGDLPGPAAALEEYRSLARMHPGVQAIRRGLAEGLRRSLDCALADHDNQRSKDLLAELRALARNNAEDNAVRAQLAHALRTRGRRLT